MRKGGFEPPRSCERQPLKLVRLPVPPLPQVVRVTSRSALSIPLVRWKSSRPLAQRLRSAQPRPSIRSRPSILAAAPERPELSVSAQAPDRVFRS